MVDKSRLIPEYSGRDDGMLSELRRETLQLLVIVIFGLAYLVVIATIAVVPSSRPPNPWEPFPTLIGLAFTGGGMYWLLRFSPLASTIGLVAGLVGTLTALIVLHPGSLLAGCFPLVVLAATGAYDWRAGLAAAVASSAVLVALAHAGTNSVPAEISGAALFGIWMTFVLAWLPTRPLRSTIYWAWSSYHLALVHAEEARLGQGELAQVSKSLREACERLERLNLELQEAKEAAETARRLKAEFAATVGHELRTPINLIVGFSQMMASPRRDTYYPASLPDCYLSDLQTISHNARHISSLVDDILDLSQIDAHRMALHREPCDLSAVAREAASSVMSLYDEAGLYLFVDVPNDVPWVVVDPARIRQVLINLLYNAVRFTHHGGVNVSAYLTATDIVVTVQDTGVGIPEENLNRVFEEFRQIQGPSRGRTGNGLGLAVCKRFIELHGGNIWAESELDYGTTISFSLPFHDNVASMPFHGKPARITVGASSPDIAILDRSGTSNRIIQRYLDGYRVHHITRPEQASLLMRNGEMRAIIVTSSDTQQAWYNYQRSHAEVGKVPTFLWHLRTFEIVSRILETAAYLTKPVNRDQLAGALRRLSRPLRRVAVIEDNQEMRSLLVRMLHSIERRAIVSEAGDGEAGLRLVREIRPDAVVVDLMMPTSDGFALLEAMQGDHTLSQIPVVVVSARGPHESMLVGMVGISRHDGLTVDEALACLKASLDSSLQKSACVAESDAAPGQLPGPPS